MKKSLILLGSSLLFLAACASTESNQGRDAQITELLSDPRVGEEVNSVCFRRNIDRFSDATDYSVVIGKGVNDKYLVLTRVCSDLEFAQSLAVESNSSCLREQDYIRVFRSAFGPSELDTGAFNRCFVDAIYEWNDDPVEAEGDGEEADAG